MVIPNRHSAASMRRLQIIHTATLVVVALTAGAILSGCGNNPTTPEKTQPASATQPAAEPQSAALVTEGQQAFRFDTFGDDQLWTDKLHLNEVVEKNVDPTTALKVGLKVDADVLPPGILGKVDLKNPATTVALLKMNAIVGIQATVDANNHITQLGVTCGCRGALQQGSHSRSRGRPAGRSRRVSQVTLTEDVRSIRLLKLRGEQYGTNRNVAT